VFNAIGDPASIGAVMDIHLMRSAGRKVEMKRSLTTLTIALSSFTLVRCGGDAGTPAGGETGGDTGNMTSTTGTVGDVTSSGAAGDMTGQVGAGGSNSEGSGGAATGSGGNNETGGSSDGGTTANKEGGSSGTGGSGGSKGTGGDAGAQPYKGVANSSCSDLALLGASWFYDWGTGQAGCPGIEYVPMVWGTKGAEQTAMGITNEIKTMVSAGYHTVLGFNEPDSNTQSNISAMMAISLWPSFNNPAMRVISPATTSGGTAFPWMSTFMTAVNASPTTMRVDAIAIHWYGWYAGSCDANASNLESYIKQIEGIPGNRPIWLTEFGCLNESNPSDQVVQTFMSGALPMLAKHPRLERYAWFPRNTHNELVTGGKLTALGAIYAAAPSRK
jgi:hypothetical protein